MIDRGTKLLFFRRKNNIGEVREWLNRAVSKTVEPKGSVGSAPEAHQPPAENPPADEKISFRRGARVDEWGGLENR